MAPGPGYHIYLVLIPAIWMISAVPTTPAAVGVFETCYQTFFGWVGVSATAALSISLFNRLMLLLWALPGAIVYIKGPGLAAAEQISVEQVEEILEGEVGATNGSEN